MKKYLQDVERKKKAQPRIPYATNIFCKIEGEIILFSKKLRKLVTYISAEMLNKILQSEGE